MIRELHPEPADTIHAQCLDLHMTAIFTPIAENLREVRIYISVEKKPKLTAGHKLPAFSAIHAICTFGM